jgi:hypothetical protein
VPVRGLDNQERLVGQSSRQTPFVIEITKVNTKKEAHSQHTVEHIQCSSVDGTKWAADRPSDGFSTL